MMFGLGIEKDDGEDQYFWLVNGKYAHAFGEDEGAGEFFMMSERLGYTNWHTTDKFYLFSEDAKVLIPEGLL